MSTNLKKRSKNGLFATLSANAIVLVVLVIMCIPFLWMLSTSFKTLPEQNLMPPTWISHHFIIQNYIILFKTINFGRPLMNSLIIAVVSVLLAIVVNSMSAYALAKFDFKGRDNIFMMMMSTMMLPGIITTIPTFMLLKYMGLLDTYTGIIIPGIASVGMIFFFRQFLYGISDEYIQAGRVDGASEFYIFWKLILPMMRPALITQGFFTFLGGWNAFMWPLIITSNDKKYTLSLALNTLQNHFSYTPNYGIEMAGTIVVMLPMIIALIVLQKYILGSLTIGGVKE